MASSIMKRTGRRKATARKPKAKIKRVPIKLMVDDKAIPELFTKLNIPDILLSLKYSNGELMFSNKTKDLVYQFIEWYNKEPEVSMAFVKKRKWANFADLYWSLPIFVSAQNWRTEEENTYFNSVNIQEGVLVCRKPGCNSRKIRYTGGSGTSGDEGLRAHFKCAVCGFKFKV